VPGFRFQAKRISKPCASPNGTASTNLGIALDLRAANATLRELIGELDQAISSRFQATFHAVATEFAQSFTRLFGGGSAQLVLSGGATSGGENGTGELTSKVQGVEIIARPPGKNRRASSHRVGRFSAPAGDARSARASLRGQIL